MTTIVAAALSAVLTTSAGNQTESTISGDYLEVRSCDVYTGPCFANGEMGVNGKEAIIAWSIKQGAWKGVNLEGLSVVAVVRTDETMGDLDVRPRSGRAKLIVDANANAEQQTALADMAKDLSGKLTDEVVEVQASQISVAIGGCSDAGCASVQAADLVRVKTRCLHEGDQVCGNESVYYQPLTKISGAMPAMTELASFQDDSLNLTWESSGQRSAFIGKFAR